MKTLMIAVTLTLAVLMCGGLAQAQPHHGHHGPHGHPTPHFARHHGWRGPAWRRYIPPIVIGRTSRTVVVTQPRPAEEPDVRYAFPGEGGTWIEFEGKLAYRLGSYLYLPAGAVDGHMTYHRICLD